jgi:hypothetical protein
MRSGLGVLSLPWFLPPELERSLKAESALAHRRCALQSCASRLGFEASIHYSFVSPDLAGKARNGHDLLTRRLPEQRCADFAVAFAGPVH